MPEKEPDAIEEQLRQHLDEVDKRISGLEDMRDMIDELLDEARRERDNITSAIEQRASGKLEKEGENGEV